jgi:hypothetical protein
MEAPERWEVTVTELADALGRGEVFEPMLAEITEILVDQRGR